MASPRYAMHPLDAIALDGFETVATAEVVLRASPDSVWQLLAIDADETIFAQANAPHAIVDRYGLGEHRCTTTLEVGGRTMCVRGFRRLLAHREVLEVRRFVTFDELVRTTYSPARFGRTTMTVDVSSRGCRPGHDDDSRHRASPADRCRLARELVGRNL